MGRARGHQSPPEPAGVDRLQPDLVDVQGELERLSAVRIGLPLVALAAIVGSILASLLGADHGPGTDDGANALGVALVAASGIPWILWLAGLQQTTRRFAVLALGPTALVDAVGWFDVDLGTGTAYQLGFFPTLMLAIIALVACPPREAAAIAAAAYAVVLGGLIMGLARSDEADVSGLVTWHAAFVFSMCAGWSVRQGTLAMARERQAREALAWQAAANERRRIARDVHDVVAHTLAVSMLHMTAARMAVRRSDPDEAVEALEEAERHGRASLSDIRRIVRLLRSEDDRALELAQPGLDDIVELVESYRVAGVPVDLTIRGPLDDVPATAGLILYRVCQEALTNAARHGTGPPSVELAADDGRVVLQVRNPVDRATPADPAHSAGAASGVGSVGSGLLGMHERVAAAGGSLAVGPRNGQWEVDARLPRDGPVAPAPQDEMEPSR